MRGTFGRVAVVTLLVALLSGCRVFVFPGPVVVPPDPSPPYVTSTTVVITNTTPYAYGVRIVIDCAGAQGQGVVIMGYSLDAMARTVKCTRGDTGPFNGVLFDVGGGLFVLGPGKSLALQATVSGSAVDSFVGKAAPFDAYGVWCYADCYDMVKFT